MMLDKAFIGHPDFNYDPTAADAQLQQDIKSALTKQEGGDHYKRMKIQPVEFITENRLGFLEGCVIKRVCRYRMKNGAEDLCKAIHELELLLELEYGEK